MAKGQKVVKMKRRRGGLNLQLDGKITIICVCIAALLGIFLAFRPNAYRISINGEVIGAIKDIKVIEGAKDTVITQLKNAYNAEVQFEEELELTRYRAKKRDYIDPTYLISCMRNNMEILIEFREFYVEDEVVGIIASEAEVEQLKAELKRRYYGDRDVNVEFGKSVETKSIFAKESDLISMDKLVQKCVTTTPKTVNYEVAQGDTLSGIASRFGTTVDSIIAANPVFANSVTLRIGQAIEVNVNEPLLPLQIVVAEPADTTQE